MSVRAFKPDPVPKATLEAIMRASLRAPSWANTQPWEFAVLGGKALEDLGAAIVGKARSGEKPNPDIPAPAFEAPYQDRMQSTVARMLGTLGIAREDKEARGNWMMGMIHFFGAPNAIVVYMDASLGQWSLLDLGLAIENLVLSAWHFGVGTCIEAAAVQYPEVFRQRLGIPKSKRIVLGVALGYPDMSAPAMKVRTEREPLEALVTWHGLD